MSDNAEWIMTDINEKKLPDPPPVCNSKLRIKSFLIQHIIFFFSTRMFTMKRFYS